ncbi:MAG TPA: hypothetical protein ENJ45_03615 [Phaeodactylibacter sp.]|nr:hypothetical protein [Phaeodactylibacter sp.]
MTKLVLTLLVFMTIVGFTASEQSSILTDSRDGKEYKTMKIGTMTIMAENLNYETEGATCFRNSEDFCNKYGRLYDYATAMDGSEEEYTQGICPDGWHIPSSEEWVYIVQNIQRGRLVYKEGSPACRLLPDNPLRLKFAGNKSASGDKVFLVGKRGLYMSSSTKDGYWTVATFVRKNGGYELTIESKQNLKTGISCRCVKND